MPISGSPMRAFLLISLAVLVAACDGPTEPPPPPDAAVTLCVTVWQDGAWETVGDCR